MVVRNLQLEGLTAGVPNNFNTFRLCLLVASITMKVSLHFVEIVDDCTMGKKKVFFIVVHSQNKHTTAEEARLNAFHAIALLKQ